MRHGFKSEANATAREVRQELGLKLTAPLDPWRLAAFLEVPLIPLSQYEIDAPRAARLLAGPHRDVFSAVTVFHGRERVVVYNDAHSKGRQCSDIAHELSHALLHHQPSPALDANGERIWNKELEDEAQWLAGALLISDEAAVDIVRRRIPDVMAAVTYGVSAAMVTFRVNVSGARKRVQRMNRWAN
jgi:Zn-dependent peptidase ImmA (M78 family)